MKITTTNIQLDKVKNDIIVYMLAEEQLQDEIKKSKRNAFEEIIIEPIKKKHFKGEKGESYLVDTLGKISLSHILLVGLGKLKDLNAENIRKAANIGVKEAKAIKIDNMAVSFPCTKLDDDKVAAAITDGLVLGDYAFDKYKTDNEKKPKPIKEAVIIHKNAGIRKSIDDAQTICNNTNFVRDMQNENADIMTSVMIAKIAKDIAQKYKLKCTVFDEKKIKKLGMGLLLAVSKGSSFPARFIIIEYNGDKKSKKKTAIVGKGITFDTGGLNLKPTKYIETMKADMSGAAVVIGTIKAAAELKLKKNLIGVIPTCENAIGSKSYKPGDVYKAYSGKTVEIGNTDAEGRLILADALSYAEKNLKPDEIIDLATLTGAVSVTFGEFAAGVISTDSKLTKKLSEAGEETYERVWELPLYEEYKDETKSEIADINNIGYGWYAGCIMGAAFLKNFVEKTPWLHIDIAGTAWIDKARGYNQKGGTGYGVRLLISYFRK